MKTRLCLLVLLACSTAAVARPPSSGTKFTADYVEANLQNGVTTREQVLDRFGEPDDREESVDSVYGRTEVYTYSSTAESAGSKLGSARAVAGRLAALLPWDSKAGSQVYRGLSKVDQAGYAARQAGDLAGVDRRNHSIQITLKKGIVSSFSLH